jgi:hypothetical protein
VEEGQAFGRVVGSETLGIAVVRWAGYCEAPGRGLKRNQSRNTTAYRIMRSKLQDAFRVAMPMATATAAAMRPWFVHSSRVYQSRT